MGDAEFDIIATIHSFATTITMNRDSNQVSATLYFLKNGGMQFSHHLLFALYCVTTSNALAPVVPAVQGVLPALAQRAAPRVAL
jgi:hypothetical protein